MGIFKKKKGDKKKKGTGFGDFLKGETGKGLLTDLAGSLIKSVGSKERQKQYSNEAQKLANERARIESKQKMLKMRLASKGSSKGGLGTGAIVGIAVGGVALTSLVLFLALRN